MATLTIRNLDDDMKRRLRLRAAGHNRSMEEEARQILGAALHGAPEASGAALYASIRERFADLGDVPLPVEPRESVRQLRLLHEAPPPYATPTPTLTRKARR